MYASKKDLSHHERVAEMLSLGLDVVDTSWSRGKLLDCIAQHPGTMKSRYVEIKNDAKGKKTEDEIRFINKRPAQCFDVRTRADVEALWELLRR